MKVVYLSYSDSIGGAARAALRLFEAGRREGRDVEMLVQRKGSDALGVLGPTGNIGKAWGAVKATLEYLPVKRYPIPPGDLFSPSFLPSRHERLANELGADIFHLHWTTAGFLSVESIARLSKPIVWTLHDCWPITGGCHYPGDCDRFATHCGSCPQLGSSKENDLSNRLYRRKMKAWSEVASRICLVCPSEWMANQARKSALFSMNRIEVIPYALDTSIYHPMPQAYAREFFSISNDALVIGFGALGASEDFRKGCDLLVKALADVPAEINGRKVELLVFGARDWNQQILLPFRTHFLGRLHDDYSLALAYNAMDVMVVPSRQDNAPQTISEAMSCGRPLVAFAATGMVDLIDHKKTGLLVKPYSISALVASISEMLRFPVMAEEMGQNGREKALRDYSYEVVSRRHAELYASILNKEKGSSNG